MTWRRGETWSSIRTPGGVCVMASADAVDVGAWRWVTYSARGGSDSGTVPTRGEAELAALAAARAHLEADLALLALAEAEAQRESS